jgi:hypothetical protein
MTAYPLIPRGSEAGSLDVVAHILSLFGLKVKKTALMAIVMKSA